MIFYLQYLTLCANEEDMRDAAAKICRDFLHGAWKTVSPQDLVFKRIRLYTFFIQVFLV